MEKEKRKCSGTFCPMNKGFDTSACQLTGECDHYLPLADMSGMEAVVDMAMVQFKIAEKDRKKLEIIFNAYVSQYMAEFCSLQNR